LPSCINCARWCVRIAIEISAPVFVAELYQAFSVRQRSRSTAASFGPSKLDGRPRIVKAVVQHRASLNMTTVPRAFDRNLRAKGIAARRWDATRCRGFMFSAAKPGSEVRKLFRTSILSTSEARPDPADEAGLSQPAALPLYSEKNLKKRRGIDMTGMFK